MANSCSPSHSTLHISGCGDDTWASHSVSVRNCEANSYSRRNAIDKYDSPSASLRAPAVGARCSNKDNLQETIQADFRDQLKQYAQMLDGKESEAMSLRHQVQGLKAQANNCQDKLEEMKRQVSENAQRSAQQETHLLHLEQQLLQKEKELTVATTHKKAALEEAAAAKVQAAASQKAIAGKMKEWEERYEYFSTQLELKDDQIRKLEEDVQKQTAEAARKAKELSQKEVEHSLNTVQKQDASNVLHSDINVLQGKLDQTLKRMKATESCNNELRKQKLQMLADMKMLEDLLTESDHERREMHGKYVSLGERMEALMKEEQAIKEAAQMESEAARIAVQDAVRDAKIAVSERATLLKKIEDLKGDLEVERSSKNKLAEKVQRRLSAAEQEVNHIKTELDARTKQLKIAQAETKTLRADAEAKLDAAEARLSNLKSRTAELSRELEQERKRSEQVQEEAATLWKERSKVDLQQQALKFERRIQELEMQCSSAPFHPRAVSSPGSASMGASILDYIPRSEHFRILESRLAAKDSDMTVEINSRVNQAEREWQWKLDSKEQEIISLTHRLRKLEDDIHNERHRNTSLTHTLADENKRLQTQCIELQRDLDASQKDYARLKETLKDARLATVCMDDDQLATSRQITRLKHSLDESQSSLQDAQLALDKESKHAEASKRDLEQYKARMEDVYRKVARLEGEVEELNKALDQKQDVMAALQMENDGWSAKMMAHREWHDQEMDTLRRQLREESISQARQLEQQCFSLGAELHELKTEHEQELQALSAEHAAHVAKLEKQLAAAERCAAELKEVSTSLTGARDEDMELLKEHVQAQQQKVGEAQQQRSRDCRDHQEQLSLLESHLKSKLAGFRAQHRLFKAQVHGDLARACSDCLQECGDGLAELQQQLADGSAAAARAQGESAGRVAQLRETLSLTLAVLAEHCSLPPELEEALETAAEAGSIQAAQHALVRISEAVQQHLQLAAATAADAVLLPLEGALLSLESKEERIRAVPAMDSSPRRSRLARVGSKSPPRRKGPAGPASPRPNALHASGAVELLEAAAAPEIKSRTQALVSRCRKLQEELAANQEQIQQLEGSVASCTEAVAKAKEESVEAAEKAREAAVAPLREEVGRLQARVKELQRQYSTEVAEMEGSSVRQLAQAQAQAQRVVDDAVAQSRRLHAELERAQQQGDGAAAELARAQEDLARHTQRAATKIETQERELGLLKERIREMERRDAHATEELRVLKQRGQDAVVAGSTSGQRT